jgi:hypothetical protein
MGKYDSGYDLMERDFYATPHWVTDALLDRVTFRGRIEDPARGGGHIIDACRARKTAAGGSDLKDGADFLKTEGNSRCIVTNPPYGKQGKLAVQFIEMALKVTQQFSGQVAMLLLVDFDSGKTRRHLFKDCPWFQQKIVLTNRIRWANLEQKVAGPKPNHAWFVWDYGSESQAPVIRYAP